MEFEALALESPLVLTHAFDGGNRRFADEAFSDVFFETFKSVECSYQIKPNARGARPQLYEAPLAEVVGGMMAESHHGESWYMLSEDLLDTAPPDKEALRSPLTLPPSLFGMHDYFDLFPKSVRPKKSCVILGGPGARSFLHADPYEWTGVNYLFEGRKLWTFVRPTPANERSLGLQRTKPDAWDGEVGAGWKSDSVDLFHVVPRVGVTDGDGKEEEDDVRLGLAPALAGALAPGDVFACVQGEGELVVIPPRWPHQVYHLSPALALAWQMCNRANLRRVLGHVLAYCQEESGGKREDVNVNVAGLLDGILGTPAASEGEEELAWARSSIEATLRRALQMRYGEEEGAQEWTRLKGQV